MKQHTFKIIEINKAAGVVVVEWDGKPDRCLAVKIPLDGLGRIMPLSEIAGNVAEACFDNLTEWEKIDAGTADFTELENAVSAATEIDATADLEAVALSRI